MYCFLMLRERFKRWPSNSTTHMSSLGRRRVDLWCDHD